MPRQLCFQVIISLTACLAASSEEGTVFWVAPTLDQCGNRTTTSSKVQCNTLAGYQKNSSIFSISHATWIFLKGEHYMNYSPITVSGTTNITWIGEEACAFSMVRCTIHIPTPAFNTNVKWLVEYSNHLTSITIENAHTVQLAFLTISATLQGIVSCNLNGSHGSNVTQYPSILTLKNVSDAKILLTVFTVTDSHREMLASHVRISDPRGTWAVNQTVFFRTSVTMDFSHCHTSYVDGIKCNFSASIAGTIFLYSKLVTSTGASVSDTYNSISIIFLQSTISTFHLSLEDYSAEFFQFSIVECNLTEFNFILAVVSMPETQHAVASVSILLWKVNIRCHFKPCTDRLALLKIQHKTKDNGGCCLLIPNITMSHVVVTYGRFSFYVKGPQLLSKDMHESCKWTTQLYLLTLHNSTFKGLVPITIPLVLAARKKAIISIVDMDRFLVRWTGTNMIHSIMKDVVLHFRTHKYGLMDTLR